MYIKHGFRQFRGNIGMNLFVMLQMVIVLFAAVCISSVITDHYRYYRYFEHYFNSEGWLYHTCFAISDENTKIADSKELESLLHKADVAACYNVKLNCKIEEGTKDMNYRVYDRELVSAYAPELEEGEWLGEQTVEDGVVPIVISANPYGISAGDILELEDPLDADFYRWKTKVVGVLKEGTKIIGWPEGNLNLDKDYKSLYYDYLLEEQKKPIILMDMEQVKEAERQSGSHAFQKSMENAMLVRYAPGITRREAEENNYLLDACVDYYIRCDMGEIEANSREILKKSLLAYEPIFIGAMLLTLISTISALTITIRQQMKSYAIFSVCGMSWQGCAWLNRVNTALVAGMALVLLTALLFLFKITGLGEETTVCFGLQEFGTCVMVSLLYVLLASGIPGIILRRNTIKKVLCENRE